MEPHHRMRLNDGDTIEWGLSSGALPAPMMSPVPMFRFLSWFSHLNRVALRYFWMQAGFKTATAQSAEPVRYYSVRETAPSYTGHEADSTLHQLYGEYILEHLGPPGRKSPSV